MQVKDILCKIPKDLTNRLLDETGEGDAIRQLQGSVVLNLLLYGVVRSEPLSATILNDLYNASLFKAHKKQPAQEVYTRHQNHDPTRPKPHTLDSYIADIPAEHFKSILDWAIQQQFDKSQTLTKKLEQLDPAIIKLSSRLLEWGLQLAPTGYAEETQLEVSVGGRKLFGDMAQSEQIDFEKNTPWEVIKNMVADSNSIITVKPELPSQTTVDAYDLQTTKFIAGYTDDLRYRVSEQATQLPPEQGGIRFLQDSIVSFFHEGEYSTNHFRLVEILDTTQGKRSYLVSNILDIDADLMTQIYRHRSSVETFFWFLKQELEINYWLSRSSNGIETQLYTALLSIPLLCAFKSANQIKGIQTSKCMFQQQLLRHIMAQLKVGRQLLDEESGRLMKCGFLNG